MPTWLQHIIVFLIAIVLCILCKIYLPQAIFVPSIGIAIYVSKRIMTPERIYKIVRFILGKKL